MKEASDQGSRKQYLSHMTQKLQAKAMIKQLLKGPLTGIRITALYNRQTWNLRKRIGDIRQNKSVTRRGFWQEAMDQPGKRKESSTGRTDGGCLRHRRNYGGVLGGQEGGGRSNHVLRSRDVDWAMESARSKTRAEQTHILAAMIQLFPVGLDVLYAVDYTGAISNFNESQFWTSTQWINCENRDVMEGIVFMKQKYKEEGMSFKCFHNREHRKMVPSAP
jgi:hypothetical protein